MSFPAISVIVPIYNVEKTIRRAINSFLEQTFNDFELLLIDDGSPDRCLEICHDYERKDGRVHVYHKDNGGLSSARNYGLKHAKGEYVIFFDPDDWVADGCLEALYEEAKKTNADMVMCDIYLNDKYRQQYSKINYTNLNHMSLLRDVVSGKVAGYCFNKLIRRDCYEKFNITYPDGIYGCEDQYAMCSLLKHDIKVSYVPKAFYHYFFYPNGLSRYYDEKTFEMDVKIRDMFASLFRDTDMYEFAINVKSFAIVSRAFYGGYKQYSSNLFVEKLKPFKPFVYTQKLSLLDKILYCASFNGFYRPARTLSGFLFMTKQFLKRIKFIR